MSRRTPSCTHSTRTADSPRAFRELGQYMALKALAAIRRFGGNRENGAHWPSHAGSALGGALHPYARHIISSHAIETGWQRFLDRLKQLWGKLGQGGKTPAAAG